MGNWKTQNNGTAEWNKISKNESEPSMQTMPLCLDCPYIQWLDHADAVLSYGFLLERIHL